jgi:hypothetical protein
MFHTLVDEGNAVLNTSIFSPVRRRIPMKKLLLFASCFAVTLILSQVSFSQALTPLPHPTEVADVTAAPCPCAQCTGAQSMVPYGCPPAPAPRIFGGKLAAFGERRAMRSMPLAAPAFAADPVAMPYQFSVSDLKPRAIRRAARLVPQPQPYPVPAAIPHPVAVPAPHAVVPAGMPMYPPGPAGQVGQKNTLLQRTGTSGPVINFLSIVRTPRDPYAGYYPYPVAPPMPH